MAARKLAAVVGLTMALALQALPVLASHGGDDVWHGGRHHEIGRGNGGAEARPFWGGKHHREHGKRHHGLRQFEGVVASYDGASLVLQPLNSSAMTVTIAISSSTVITADEGVTATLAQDEQVHVKAVLGADGSYTAVRVTIQGSENDAAQTPEADGAAQPTAEPTTTPDGTDTAATTPRKHHKHGGDSDSQRR